MTLIWSGITQHLAGSVGWRRVWKDVLTAPCGNGAERSEMILLNPIFANVGGILWIILAEMKPLLNFLPCLGEVNPHPHREFFSQKDTSSSGIVFLMPWLAYNNDILSIITIKLAGESRMGVPHSPEIRALIWETFSQCFSKTVREGSWAKGCLLFTWLWNWSTASDIHTCCWRWPWKNNSA